MHDWRESGTPGFVFCMRCGSGVCPPVNLPLPPQFTLYRCDTCQAFRKVPHVCEVKPMTQYRKCECPQPRPNGIDMRMCVTCLGDIPRKPVRMKRIGWLHGENFYRKKSYADAVAETFPHDTVRAVYVRADDE